MYNVRAAQAVLNGGEILYSMLCYIINVVEHLPGCKTTANVKMLSDDVSAASKGIIQTMREIVSNAERVNDIECDEDADTNENMDEDDLKDAYTADEIPTAEELSEFLNTVSDFFDVGVPIFVSADIYIADPENNHNTVKEDN